MEITDKEFEEVVLKSELPVLLEFWASWCPPCQMMASLLDQLEKEYENRIKIVKVNLDKNPRSSSKFNVMGVPTFIFIRNGEEIKRCVGALSGKQLKRIIEEND